MKNVTPQPAGSPPPVLTKKLLRDLLDDGWPYEKAEGVVILDDVLVVNDNDGDEGAPTEILVLPELTD